MSELIGRGSVKDLYKIRGADNRVELRFSNRVSVFDYGVLPEDIQSKGTAQLKTALHFFRLLRRAEIATLWDEELSEKMNSLVMIQAAHAKFMKDPFTQVKSRYQFLPVECIFRLGVPPGSSLLKREPNLTPFTVFDEIRVEFSTKLEAQDRLLESEEVKQLVGGADIESALIQYAKRVASVLRDEHKRVGLSLWDGKIECALDRETGLIHMIDAITLDELRVTLPGLESIPLSKELLRQWLSKTLWAHKVKEAKREARSNWQRELPYPPRLGDWRMKKLGDLYVAYAQSLEQGSAKMLVEWVLDKTQKPKVYVLGHGGREVAVRSRLQKEGALLVEKPELADAIWISTDNDLASGKVDYYLSERAWVYGPTKEAAKLEWSKQFGRLAAEQAGIPIPRYESDPKKLHDFTEPPVVKCNGLMGGKGVVVADDWKEAEEALAWALEKGGVLLEERCEGPETSAFFAVSTGFHGIEVQYLGSARDFKRRYVGDDGPNTGGMGAYAPHPLVSEADVKLFTAWVKSVVQLMSEKGHPYNGILYLGLLKDKKRGWVLLEFNARFGDPETQALVSSWKDGFQLRSLLQLSLDTTQDFSPAYHTVCVALVHPDYPRGGEPLTLEPWAPQSENLDFYPTGASTGRIAYLVGKGASLQEAGDEVFETLVRSPWKDKVEWRADILP